jgi:hypothetical protein
MSEKRKYRNERGRKKVILCKNCEEGYRLMTETKRRGG